MPTSGPQQVVADKGRTPRGSGGNSTRGFTTIYVDKRMKAELDAAANAVRAELDRWVSLQDAIGHMMRAYKKVSPPVDPSRVAHWAQQTKYRRPLAGRPRRPGSPPRVSRASRKAAKLPHSPALAD